MILDSHTSSENEPKRSSPKLSKFTFLTKVVEIVGSGNYMTVIRFWSFHSVLRDVRMSPRSIPSNNVVRLSVTENIRQPQAVLRKTLKDFKCVLNWGTVKVF